MALQCKKILPNVWKEKVKITAVAAHVLIPDIRNKISLIKISN